MLLVVVMSGGFYDPSCAASDPTPVPNVPWDRTNRLPDRRYRVLNAPRDASVSLIDARRSAAAAFSSAFTVLLPPPRSCDCALREGHSNRLRFWGRGGVVRSKALLTDQLISKGLSK